MLILKILHTADLAQGIIGIGYERLTAAAAAAQADDFKFHGVESEFEMAGYFSTAHKHNAFGAAAAAGRSKRRLIERVDVAFPLRFHAGGVPSKTPIIPPSRRRLIESVTLSRRMF